MQNFLVTGGSGFLGTHLVDYLLQEYPEATVIVPTHHSPLNESIAFDTRIRVVSYDEIFNHNWAVPIDAVFNLASYGVNPLDTSPEKMVEANVFLLVRLVLFAVNLNIQTFLHVGSASEYGNQDGLTHISEDTIPMPNRAYGASKLAGATIARTLTPGHNTRFIHIRPFGVYGPFEKSNKLVPLLINHLQSRKPLNLTHGNQVRDYLYVKDFTSACTRLFQSDAPDGAILNVCSGIPTSLRMIASLVQQAVGGDPALLNWDAVVPPPDEPKRLVGSHNRLRRFITWEPTYSLSDGIRETIMATPSQSGSSPSPSWRQYPVRD